MTYKTTVTSKGQVTIPAKIRKQLKIIPGQKVEFELRGQLAAIKKSKDWQAGLDELHKKIAKHMKDNNIKPLSDKELRQAIDQAAADEANRRYLQSLQGR